MAHNLDGVQLSTIDNILKLDYQGPIREQLTNKNVLLAHIKKDTTRNSFQGLRSVIPVHTGRNVGRAFRGEGQILPAAGAQAHKQAAFHMSYLYGRIQITGQTIAASRNDKGSFARALDLEMKGLQTDMNLTLSRCVWGDGTGILSLCCPSATANVNTITASNKIIRVCSARWLEVGMQVDVIKNTGEIATGAPGTHGHDPVTIESFTLDTASKYGPAHVTLSGLSAAFSGSDLDAGKWGLYLYGSREMTTTVCDGIAAPAASIWGKPVEMWGLPALVGTGNPGYDASSISDATDGTADTYSFNRGGLGTGATDGTQTGFMGGLDRDDSANAFWRSNRVRSVANVSNGFDELQEAYDLTEIEGDVEPGLLLTSHRIRRQLGKLFVAERRFGTEKTLKGGWTGVEFNNGVIVVDKHASTPGDGRDMAWFPSTNAKYFTPAANVEVAGGQSLDSVFSSIYLLKPSTIEFVVMEDLAWEDTGGVIVRSGVGAAAIDQYEAFMKAYWNLAIVRPNQNSVINHVTDART